MKHSARERMPARMARPLVGALGVWACFVASGCAPALVCPARGGDAWREVRSPHFVVRTDLPSAAARAVVEDFERRLAILTTRVFIVRSHPIEGHSDVVVFRRRSTFKAFASEGEEGSLRVPGLMSDPDGVPTIVVPHGQDETLSHELTHLVTLHMVPQMPRWLGEGLAQLCQTLEIKDGRFSFGRPPHDLSLSVGLVRRLPSAQALRTALPEEFLEGGLSATLNYVGSWALVHFLMASDRSGFYNFLSHLSLGESPQYAWGESFTFTEAEVEGYGLHLLDDQLSTFAADLPPQGAPLALTERTLDDREVHLLWASLRRDSSATDPDLLEAARQSPDGADVLLATALAEIRQKRYAQAEQLLLRSVKLASPSDAARHFYLLGRVRIANLRGGEFSAEEAAAALNEAASHLAAVTASGAPASPPVLDLLALNAAVANRFDEALGLLDQAIARRPACYYCYFTRAQVLAAEERFGEAAESQARGMAVLPDSTSAEAIVRMRRELDRYRHGGRDAPVSPPTRPPVRRP